MYLIKRHEKNGMDINWKHLNIFLTKWFDLFLFMVLVLEPCVNCYFEHSYVFIPTFVLWYTYLTHFRPMSHFNISWKCRKTYGFLTFSGGIDMWHWAKMRWETNLALLLNTITFFSFCSFLEDKHQVKYKVYNLIWLYY